MTAYCKRIISYSFYALFFFVPLVFTNNTSELFELNKMWLTWGLTLVIAGAWITQMIAKKQFRIQRTPLDIPILLFLTAHIIATIFSLDQRISWWGYYSRFNGGTLSMLTYAFLYYAFVTNFSVKHALKSIGVLLFSGFLVALWGFPSHFGKDPTCLMFTGVFDVSCWTEGFKPTIRIFSTIGQPAWLAAYLAVLLPITIAFFLKTVSSKSSNHLLLAICYLLLIILFYLDLIFANTRAGFLAFWTGNIAFWIALFINQQSRKQFFFRIFLLINGIFLISNFFLGAPIPNFSKFTFSGLTNQLTTSQTGTEQPASASAPTDESQVSAAPAGAPTGAPSGALAGTDSGTIRLLVWQGAIDGWKAHPLFGTGVETFAFAYYKHRLAAHNLTSEWDYLYNKAHNEYLNYLTTTGIFGLGSHVAMNIFFLYIVALFLLPRNVSTKLPLQNRILPQTSEEAEKHHLLITGLFAGYITILITNFLGFSVVIMNLFLFLIPAFTFLLMGILSESSHAMLVFPKNVQQKTPLRISAGQWIIILLLIAFLCYLLLTLLRFWQADKHFALGSNLNRVGQYQQAYPELKKAYELRPNEPSIQEEFALGSAVIGAALLLENQTTSNSAAIQFIQQATSLSDQLIQNHPNSILSWKNRVRVFGEVLGKVDPTYLVPARDAIEKAYELAPTDAKVALSRGVLYGQTGDIKKAVEVLEDARRLKPDYKDIYFPLGIFYRELATNGGTFVVDQNAQQKAEEYLRYSLNTFNKNEERVISTLQSWGIQP